MRCAVAIICKSSYSEQHSVGGLRLGLVARIFLCLFLVVFLLYRYIDGQNQVMELRLQVPALTREIRELKARKTRLSFEVESFENPVHLMELARKPEYGHLKHPLEPDIMIVEMSNDDSP